MIEQSMEITPSTAGMPVPAESAKAAAIAEIQGAILLAKQYPRDETTAFEKVSRSCNRASFAEDARYSYPRGNTTVSGPSVNMAREMARCWGNIRYGLNVLSDSEDKRLIEGWAWDVETNTKVTASDEFKKLIQRKQRGKTEWIEPDERELRELTNRRGAILVRNCLLQIFPRDIVDEAMKLCQQTLQKGAKKDPDKTRRQIILAFQEINVSPKMIQAYLDHPLDEATPEELTKLIEIGKSIKDGNSTWHEYVKDAEDPDDTQKGPLGAMPESAKSKAKRQKKEETKTEPEPPAEETSEETEASEQTDDERAAEVKEIEIEEAITAMTQINDQDLAEIGIPKVQRRAWIAARCDENGWPDADKISDDIEQKKAELKNQS